MPLHRGSEELLPIYKSCVFRSDTRVDSHWHVSQELAEHMIAWKRGSADVAMFKGQLQQLELYVLRYGAEVEVKPRPFQDFTLVHMSLRGAAEIEADGVRVDIGEGRAAVLSPKHTLNMRWHIGTEQLIVKVPHALMQDVSGLDASHVQMAPACLLPSKVTSHWDLMMRSMLNVVRTPADAPGPDKVWLDHFERNVALFLLSHQSQALAPNTSKSATNATDEQAEGEGPTVEARRIDAMVQYMKARLGAPVSLYDLAAAAGVSVRTLNALCHRHLGDTPMNLLRNIRLDSVRTQLLLRSDISVTEAALDFGFGHLGRFSSYYAERFGELPKQTMMTRKRSTAT